MIRAVHRLEPNTSSLLVDVGAAPFGTGGPDISHALLYLTLWPCGSSGGILAFEPIESSFGQLETMLRSKLLSGQTITQAEQAELSRARVVRERNHTCVALVPQPASDSERPVVMAPQPGAGVNTASLSTEFHHSNTARGGRWSTTSVTVAATVDRLHLPRSVLIAKVDVEGHEVETLRGFGPLLSHVHMVLLEYSDKTSPAIFRSMKARYRDDPAAPSVASMEGQSLRRIQRWADRKGFDAFMLGSDGGNPLLLPITGELWDDGYEVCRDKSAKFSADGVHWTNFTPWSPDWSAVCWYDVALILRTSPLFAPLTERYAHVPRRFCRRLVTGWYPDWISAPPLTHRLNCSQWIPVGRGGDRICGEFTATRE